MLHGSARTVHTYSMCSERFHDFFSRIDFGLRRVGPREDAGHNEKEREQSPAVAGVGGSSVAGVVAVLEPPRLSLLSKT